jgi:ribose 5-phosphate isomerase A
LKLELTLPDFRKLSSNLLTNWPSIPIEVAPLAVPDVLTTLRLLGSKNPAVRPSVSQPHHADTDPSDAAIVLPLKTDQGFYIIDAPFAPLKTAGAAGEGWDVVGLAKAIRQITGVLEVGIFSGEDGIDVAARYKAEGKDVSGGRIGGEKPVMAYFGMEDGSVETRIRKDGVPGITA